jgi:hypothetical protein
MTNITTVPYFYDKQFRRYIQQFIRLFSGFQFQIATDTDGNPVYQTVPVRYGDSNRMANHILKQNSENKTLTVPMISCYISGLNMDPAMRTYPQFEDKLKVFEKKYNDETGAYENELGNMYTVERHQPVPYRLQMNCDIWTSNTDQKLQLLEQILVLFNPSLNIHTNNNPLDWSTLSVVELQQTLWSNRTIQQGVDDIIDVSTLIFSMPVLINPPAKVKRNVLIHTIINNIHTIPTDTADDIKNIEDLIAVSEGSSYQIITLENYKVRIITDSSGVTTAKILTKNNGSTNTEGGPLTWDYVLRSYGEFRPNISQIRLKQTTNPGEWATDIIGTLNTHPTNSDLLLVDLDNDTIPSNTQDPITAIIDPQANYPGDGTLSAATVGDRYLLSDDISNGPTWGGTIANKNDIIEYNGVSWSVTFDASANTESEHYTTNLTTLDRLKWTGEQWINAYEGTYNAGYWRIYL